MLKTIKINFQGLTKWDVDPLGPTLFALQPVIKLIDINSMRLSDPWVDSLDIIALERVKRILLINPMGLSAPWFDSLHNIASHPVKNV